MVITFYDHITKQQNRESSAFRLVTQVNSFNKSIRFPQKLGPFDPTTTVGMQSLPTLTVCTLYAGIIQLSIHTSVRKAVQRITEEDRSIHHQYRHSHSS